jgi:hypothetical protein
MQGPMRATIERRQIHRRRFAALALLAAASGVYAQSQAPANTGGSPADMHPIAIVPLDSGIAGAASAVTGDLQVYGGRAFITANASVTSGAGTTHVTLPFRGVLLVCSLTTVKLAADSTSRTGDVPGLLLALDHGALEMSYASGRNSDTLMTPDFRILISGPGAVDVKVRLGPKGDTCVDNAGANAPYVLVSSVFDGGAYRVQPGQRVMFQHGSLHEVVDQEKESCGCPPGEPKGNEFPVAQSQQLALNLKPVPAMPEGTAGSSEPIAPLVYKSADHMPKAATADNEGTPTNAKGTAAGAPAKAEIDKKPGFFTRMGRFFKRIFGAE